MNRKYLTILIALVILAVAISLFVINPVNPEQCGDGICGISENSKKCPQDCSITGKCGDGVCDAKESANPGLCSKDCSNKCGNGICDSGETCSSCEPDCGSCPVPSGSSRFGVNLNWFTYDTTINDIRELGGQIYVRTDFMGDAFGWKAVKNSQASINLCRSCCDPARSSCTCASGDTYYCTPSSRDGLLQTPILIDFYNNNFNQFVVVYTSRYDDKPPGSLISDYPHGHEGIYREHVSFLAQNFGNKIKYWDVGNENDALAFWMGTPAEYADMVVLASEEIRRKCPECKVGISFAHPNVSPKNPTLAAEWYAQIGRVCNSFDFIDAHYYSPVFIQQGELDRLKQTCPGKEFVSTETGVPDKILGKGVSQNAGGTTEKQAQDLIKYNTLLFAEGYSKIYWYLVDADLGQGTMFLYNALIDEVGHARKPAFSSYKTMISKVDYFTSLTKLAEGQYKYTFANKNPVYVLWCDTGTCALPTEISGTVKVTDYLGNGETIQASQIVLSESPIFVE